MSFGLAVRFPLGRYHATPWDRAVNEGHIEWPPSPWRIVRALVATWKERCPDLDEGLVVRVLDQVSAPPTYRLPETAIGHTRQYVPNVDNKTALAFDTFATMAPTHELFIEWDGDLSDAETQALSRLAESLPYLGRADSVCCARLARDEEARPPSLVCWRPVRDGDGVTRLLVPELPFDLATATVTPTQMRSGGRLQPPHTRWVSYAPEESFTSPPRVRASTDTRIAAVRWHIADRGLPPLEQVVPLAQALRSRLIRAHRDPSTTLSGHADGEAKRTDQHRHAHFLAVPAEDGRRIESLVLWAPEGLSRREAAAAVEVSVVRTAEHLRDLGDYQLVVEVLGSAEQALGPLAGRARRWRSVTPFVPARWLGKRRTPERWLAHLESEVRRELGYRDLPGLVGLEIVPDDHPRGFETRRHNSQKRRPGAAVHIELEAEADGPVVLGHLSHFGLGLFAPAD